MRMRSKSIAVLSAGLVLFAAGCGDNSEPAGTSSPGSGVVSTAKIVIGGSSSNSWLPVRLALDKGYFAAAGLPNVEFTAVASAPAASAALASGDVQFATLAVERGILSTIAGRATVCVMSLQDTPPTTLVVRGDSGIQPGDWGALRGRTIGVSIGGWSEIMVKHLLAKNGVNPSEVRFTSTPDATTMLTALRRGSIDAFSGIEPAQREAVESGDGRIFFDLEDAANLQAQWPSPFVATCLLASQEYASKNPQILAAVRTAIQRAAKEVEADPSVAVALAKKLQPNVDTKVLTASVDHLAVTWSKDGTISEAAVKNLQDLLVEYKVLPKSLPYDQVVIK